MGQSTEWACTFLKIESFNHLISILRSNTQCRKMVRHTLKILQQLMQDFYIVSDHFTILRSKGFRSILMLIFFQFYLCFSILLIKVGEKYIFCLHLECCRNISGLGRSKKLGLEGFQLGGVITPITYHDTVEYLKGIKIFWDNWSRSNQLYEDNYDTFSSSPEVKSLWDYKENFEYV